MIPTAPSGRPPSMPSVPPHPIPWPPNHSWYVVLKSPLARMGAIPAIKTIATIDHTPQPHPASPTGTLPQGFGNGYTSTGSKHTSFSSYRDHAQQFGPLQKTIKEKGIGGIAGSELGAVQPLPASSSTAASSPTVSSASRLILLRWRR
ncbi:unnamed protein product [Parascedosporium putredinis]|uniref:Uncharacterized protein n=1 Tax=Parascedosporium putredinis TaxID=1442378 RepID=A0A9P1GWK3_9PEZI|nr:unnamed protein product [Parascedosporium putredinis]CAI7988910.1 unnamed protein product [Parascedosporium putredinis]